MHHCPKRAQASQHTGRARLRGMVTTRREFVRSCAAGVAALAAGPALLANADATDGPFERWARIHGLERRPGESGREVMQRCWHVWDRALLVYTGRAKFLDPIVRPRCLHEYWLTQRDLLCSAFGKSIAIDFQRDRDRDRFNIREMLRA
jgi:hypothetical protein